MTKTFIKLGAKRYDTAEWEFPSERTFRDAWAVDNTNDVITVDLEKAKDIWRDKIRAARIPEFEKLDTKFMKALETGADITDIIAQKQALRDAPDLPEIDNATTIEELKAIQPAGLKVE